MKTHKKIALAGATGYLGRHIVHQLLLNRYEFVALARNVSKLQALGLAESQIAEVQVTEPETLTNVFEGVDTVISTVGITRQKDGLTYMNVDYQANMNLLNEALSAGVRKFVYVSAVNGQQFRHLKIMEAKEKFVDALQASGLEYTVLRPNGFFSDMQDFLDMARRGRVYLFGNGEYKLNPIHGEDLAEVCLQAVDSNQTEISVGGPDVLTQNQIGELALDAQSQPAKITHIPDWVRKTAITLVRTFTSSKTYGPIEFFLTMMGQDNIAPHYGHHRLADFFRQQARNKEKVLVP
ncbi:MAG: SDR family oxidoreductase [Bacteroidota bacterium]